jgi:cystathionine beta-lyase/cystathionine gamma-synthase
VFSSPEAAERAFNVVSGREQAKPGEAVELIYSRFNHPNAEILEDQMVPLETGAGAAVVFNSGMAAFMTSVMTFTRPGDTLIYTTPLYGGTQHLIHDLLEPWGVCGTAVRAGDTAALAGAIRNSVRPAAVLIESPANPTMTMTDIRQAANAAAERLNPPVIMVDNTFLGPAFQHPLTLGADLVLYSATKYLSGFSDMLAGLAVAREESLISRIRAKRGIFGNILPPDECWLLDSRLPTVNLRMTRQSKNAQRIAERLATHRRVRRVHYPSLFTDAEQIRIRDLQCDHPGGLISIELREGKRAAFDFLRHLRIARNAVSLGGMETLVCHPKTTTHSGLSPEEMRTAGITDSLVRISIGIEDWRDLLADFEQALDFC